METTACPTKTDLHMAPLMEKLTVLKGFYCVKVGKHKNYSMYICYYCTHFNPQTKVNLSFLLQE